MTTEGLITLEDIIEIVYEGDSQCNCLTPKPLSDYTNNKKFKNYCRECDFTKRVNIFAFFRIGLYKPDEECLE